LKHYSTKEQESKNLKTTYNSSYKYGAPHPESNIPNIEFNVRQNETKKVGAFQYLTCQSTMALVSLLHLVVLKDMTFYPE
jgi:hypothetical protein